MNKYWVLFFAYLSIGTSYSQISGPASGPAKGFSLAPDDAGFIQSSVNQFTGQVQFSIPIASLQGRGSNGYTVQFNYNSTGVKEAWSTWNKDAPTSVLGLGWDFSTPKIVCDHKGTGNREDDDFYLLEGGAANELVFSGVEGAEWKFVLKNFQFWKIRYNRSSELWTIYKEDGSRFLYGNKWDGSTVQYMVKWGNWIGNSSLATGQSQMAYIWNLHETTDMWGDKLRFIYELHQEQVGTGTSHTKASYLQEIRNLNNDRIVFSYLPKLNNQPIPGVSPTANGTEFIDPNTINSEPDGYQEKYETKFLDKIVTYTGMTELVQEIRLGYTFLGTGNMVKRLLSSYTIFSRAGTSRKGYSFTYENGLGTTVNTGVLKTITSPLGEITTYNYQYTELSSTSLERDIDQTGNFREVKLWHGQDFTVLTRRATSSTGSHLTSGQDVRVDVLSWEAGQWRDRNLITLSGVVLKDIYNGRCGIARDQDFQLVTGKDFFAILHRPNQGGTYTLNIFKRKEVGVNEWYQSSFSHLTSNYSDQAVLLAGDNFILVGGKTSRHTTYAWSSANKSWTGVETVKPTGIFYRYAAAGNYFIAHTSNLPSSDRIIFYYQTKANNSTFSSYTLPSNISGFTNGENYWHAGNTCAVLMAGGANEYIYTWDENFSPSGFVRHNTGIGVSDQSYVNIHPSGTVLMAGSDRADAFRYDGQSWIYSTQRPNYNLLATNELSRNLASMGDDFFITIHESYTLHVTKFNANSRVWQLETRSGGSWNNFANDNAFIYNGTHHYKNTDNTFSPAGLVGGSSTVGGLSLNSFLTQGGYNFFGYASNVKVVKNGILSTVGSLISSTQTVQSILPCSSNSVNMQQNPQFGYSTFATTNTTLHQDATRVRFYKKSDTQFAGRLSKFTVASIATASDITRSASYQYDFATATTDKSGLVPQFNKVTVLPNGNITNGYTETYFVNGLPASDFPTPFNNNMSTHFTSLTGVPYRTKGFSSTSTLVNETATAYQVFGDSYFSGNQLYARPVFSMSKNYVDNLEEQTEVVYRGGDGLPWFENNIRMNGTSQGSRISNVYTYWSDVYTPVNSRYLLSPVVMTDTYRDSYISINTSGFFGPPLWIINGYRQSSSYTKWKNWGVNAVPAPYETYVLKNGADPSSVTFLENSYPHASAWELAERIQTRNDRGFPTEVKKGVYGSYSSVIHDAYRPLPIATIENASLAQIYYNGFEDLTQNFSLDSKTGKKSGTTSLPVALPAPGNYLLSYWKKESGTWSFVQNTISAPTTIGGAGILIDEVRLHPINAFMQTNAYDKYGQKINSCDTNGYVQYAEHNEFFEPTLLRDTNKNIVIQTYSNIKN